MIDSCIIDRPGKAVTDPETGKVAPSYTPVYTGRCKVQQTLAQSSSREAGGAVFTVQPTGLHIPVGAGPVRSGDRVRMVSGVTDPALLGNQYRVVETFEKTWPTAQRLRVEEMA